jgi:hypothetical protein
LLRESTVLFNFKWFQVGSKNPVFPRALYEIPSYKDLTNRLSRISEIVTGRQLVFIGQANLIKHTAEINELTHFCIRASQAIHRRHNKRNDKSSLRSCVNVGKIYKPRIDANAHESEPPLFASISVHSWFIRVAGPKHESTRMHTNQNALFASISVHSWSIRVASPNRESTRMHTNQNPLFASISVHSWFIRVASPNHESTRMHTNQNPLFASISVHSWFIRGRQVSTSEKSIGILRFFSRSAGTGYRFFAVLPE